jgi:hypothetical protein
MTVWMHETECLGQAAAAFLQDGVALVEGWPAVRQSLVRRPESGVFGWWKPCRKLVRACRAAAWW